MSKQWIEQMSPSKERCNWCNKWIKGGTFYHANVETSNDLTLCEMFIDYPASSGLDTITKHPKMCNDCVLEQDDKKVSL